MFNESWILLAVIVALVAILLAQPSLLAMAVLLLTIVPAGWIWDRLALRALSYRRELGESRAFAGEAVALTLRVTNRKPLPVPWLRIEDSFPNNLPLAERELDAASDPSRSMLTNVVSLRWYERMSWTYQLRCQRRGFYFFGPAVVRSGDIFGLFQSAAQVSTVDRLIVYPRVVPLPELGFPGKEPFGEVTGRRALFEDPVRTVGIRDYHPEDSFKHVHWKATARQQQLQVKVYEPTISQHLVIFLNIATYAQAWIGIDPEKQEYAISVAASIAYHATRHRYAVGLIANGSVPKSDQSIKVLPGRDPNQLTHILEALAAVTSFATASIEKLMLAESPLLPWGATLVVVSVVVTEELIVSLMRLRDAGRRVVLVSMDPAYADSAPPGITVFHLPDTQVAYGGGGWEAA